MTPKFTTPCYVRVDDKDKRKEVCEKLETIGYKNIAQRDDEWILTKCESTDVDYLVEYMKTAIDCSDNIDLFLALAGMREDTDKGQWFVTEKGELFVSKYECQYLHSCMRVIDGIQRGIMTVKRATATEIIEHFKK